MESIKVELVSIPNIQFLKVISKFSGAFSTYDSDMLTLSWVEPSRKLKDILYSIAKPTGIIKKISHFDNGREGMSVEFSLDNGRNIIPSITGA